MEANKADVLSSSILHLQLSLEYLDEIGSLQDLFKQDFKQQIKRTTALIEDKLNSILKSMTEDEKTSYFELLERKMGFYRFIDHLNTFNLVTLYENQIKTLSEKLVA